MEPLLHQLFQLRAADYPQGDAMPNDAEPFAGYGLRETLVSLELRLQMRAQGAPRVARFARGVEQDRYTRSQRTGASPHVVRLRVGFVHVIWVDDGKARRHRSI